MAHTGVIRMRSDEKHACPGHNENMRYGATLWNFSENLTLNGIEIKNQFYYCPVDGCTSCYSSATGNRKILDLVEALRTNT